MSTCYELLGNDDGARRLEASGERVARRTAMRPWSEAARSPAFRSFQGRGQLRRWPEGQLLEPRTQTKPWPGPAGHTWSDPGSQVQGSSGRRPRPSPAGRNRRHTRGRQRPWRPLRRRATSPISALARTSCGKHTRPVGPVQLSEHHAAIFTCPDRASVRNPPSLACISLKNTIGVTWQYLGNAAM